ncbi:MAG: RNA polymerase subunit sigma-24 [Bacillota bacterium]|nr:MAG: RNA polymerase subunit sigma-24 [Bacillota bacterium]
MNVPIPGGRPSAMRRSGGGERRAGGGRRPHQRIQSLIDRALTGDVRAFETLVTEHYGPVHAYAARMVGGQAAEDVAQDVFLRVYRSLHTFRGDASFTTWLFRITHNVCNDYRRRMQREPALRLDGPAPGDDTRSAGQALAAAGEGAGENPELRLESLELHETVQRALMKLSEKHRAVLVLHDMHGFRYDEIKHIVGCSLGTVRSRLHYARRALRQILEEELRGELASLLEERPGRQGAAGGPAPA